MELNCKRLRFFSWSPLRMFLIANSSTKMNSSKAFISNCNLPHNIWRFRTKAKSKRFLVGATLWLCLKITTRRLATPTSKLFNFVGKWEIDSARLQHTKVQLYCSFVGDDGLRNFLFRGQRKIIHERWVWFREDWRWTFLFRGQQKMNHEHWTWFREDGTWTFLFRGQRKMNHEHWTWFSKDWR